MIFFERFSINTKILVEHIKEKLSEKDFESLDLETWIYSSSKIPSLQNIESESYSNLKSVFVKIIKNKYDNYTSLEEDFKSLKYKETAYLIYRFYEDINKIHKNSLKYITRLANSDLVMSEKVDLIKESYLLRATLIKSPEKKMKFIEKNLVSNKVFNIQILKRSFNIF